MSTNFFGGGRQTVHQLGSSWINACECDSRSAPRPTLENAALAFRHDPHWAGQLAYDEMLQSHVLRGSLITDSDVHRAQEWLQKAGLHTMGPVPVRAAMEIVAEEHPFHPVRDWLDALEWDGTLRVADWLITYLGAPAIEYSRSIGTMFLIAMVARIYRPGCKCDYMLVLEGEQGNLKSQICRSLAGDAYFSDHLPDLSGDPVRLSQHLRGRWLIEIAELSAFTRADASLLKSFVTRQEERFTPKFGRAEVHEPRQCVFVGTTNKSAYLRDETGGRRFWGCPTGHIEVARLADERDLLFAEAKHLFDNGHHWWPDPAFETQFIRPQQDVRYQGDAWEHAVQTWDHCIPDTDANGRPRYDNGFGGSGEPLRTQLSPPYRLLDIARGCLHFEPTRFSKREEMRLVAVLESLGWVRSRKTRYGVPWYPPTP
jgi:predicted P-loop ATPase